MTDQENQKAKLNGKINCGFIERRIVRTRWVGRTQIASGTLWFLSITFFDPLWIDVMARVFFASVVSWVGPPCSFGGGLRCCLYLSLLGACLGRRLPGEAFDEGYFGKRALFRFVRIGLLRTFRFRLLSVAVRSGRVGSEIY